MTILTGKILGAVLKKSATKQGPKTQYQLTLDAIGSLDTKIKKKLKEKIKTGKFNRYGNLSK